MPTTGSITITHFNRTHIIARATCFCLYSILLYSVTIDTIIVEVGLSDNSV